MSCVVRVEKNFLPERLAERLAGLFETASVEERRQVVSGQYAKAMRFSEDFLPGPDEVYTARFLRCKGVLDTEPGREVRGRLEKVFGSLDLRAHVMRPGDHFRAHVDERVGEVGFTLNLVRGWKLDWGGLLVAVDKEVRVFPPQFNELVVMSCDVPHFVTPVCEWAKSLRLTLVGFGREVSNPAGH